MSWSTWHHMCNVALSQFWKCNWPILVWPGVLPCRSGCRPSTPTVQFPTRSLLPPPRFASCCLTGNAKHTQQNRPYCKSNTSCSQHWQCITDGSPGAGAVDRECKFDVIDRSKQASSWLTRKARAGQESLASDMNVFDITCDTCLFRHPGNFKAARTSTI